MAIKTAVITIDVEGRDKGKQYLITEMPAWQVEEWGYRLLFALGKGGADIPENALDLGIAGVAAVGIRALVSIPWELAKPLLDDLMGCVTFFPDPVGRPSYTRALVATDIEEALTRVRLKDEVFYLHTGFSIAATLSRLRGAMSMAADQPQSNGPNIETSPATSPQ